MNLIEKIASSPHKGELEKFLNDLIEALDVSTSKYKEAENHYKSVGEWLGKDGTVLSSYMPKIYAQGSFALGTVIKPVEDGDYDIDAVCLLEKPPQDITQQRLKELVGERLKSHEKYKKMLDPSMGGRRCWTLNYSDSSKFHMDILPAIPDDSQWLIGLGINKEIAEKSICITDKTTWDESNYWPRSNPHGYLLWFNSRMVVIYNKLQEEFKKKANVQDVPSYQISTPLQNTIKILKKHRDVIYENDDHKPISIIITTLAAKAYDNQEFLVDSLVSIISKMKELVEIRGKEWWVENPVNPQENFADKWNETPEKKDLFFCWIERVEKGILDLISDLDSENNEISFLSKFDNYLTENYGISTADYVSKKRIKIKNIEFSSSLELSEETDSVLSYYNHVQQINVISYDLVSSVSVLTHVTRKGFQDVRYFSKGPIVCDKGCNLSFRAIVDKVESPFSVQWQVVNTGKEATVANALRGGFYLGYGKKGLHHKESTLYSGIHWVECFIIKNGICKARSGKIKIRILKDY